MDELCPMGCGGPAGDEFGGPCAACWAKVDAGHAPNCECADCMDLPDPPSYRPPSDELPGGAGTPGS
jgi:hypothetical protein